MVDLPREEYLKQLRKQKAAQGKKPPSVKKEKPTQLDIGSHGAYTSEELAAGKEGIAKVRAQLAEQEQRRRTRLSPQQFKPLYHGTAHWFSPGDTIEPTVPATGIEANKAAWATTNLDTAAGYAASKGNAQEQLALFTPIYEVKTMSPRYKLRTNTPVRSKELQGLKVSDESKGDPKGLRVKKLAAYADYEGKVM